MYTTSILAVSGALLGMVAAVPMADSHHHHRHHQRDYVWVTHTEEVVETVGVTKTVWIEPGETPPTNNKPAGYKPASYSSPASQPAAYTPPAPPAYSSSSSSSSSSVYVAPSPSSSTSTYVAPVPTSTYVAPTTYAVPTTYAAPSSSSAAPAPASSSSSSSGSGSSGGTGVSGMAASGKTYTGDLTWYDVGMGSCGKTSSPSDKIVAVSHVIMEAYNTGNPNNNPLCGKYVTITGTDGQKYKAEIVDTCPGCDESSLDLSQDFFNTVTNNGDGRVHDIEWCFD